MILPDTNLLIYAYNPSSAYHARAKTWLAAALSGDESVALAWPVLLAFARLTTNPRVLQPPLAPGAALAVLAEWRAQPNVAEIYPGPRHWEIFRELVAATQASAHLLPDADLAALAIEHGATLYTQDGDFARFPGLRVRFPLTVG